MPRMLMTLVLLAIASGAHAQINVGGGGGTQGGGIREHTRIGQEDPQKKAEALSKRAQQQIDRAYEFLRKAKLRQAISMFKSAVDFGRTAGVRGEMVNRGVVDDALRNLDGIYRQGKEKLEESEKLYTDGKYVESVTLAEDVRKQYGGVFAGIPGAAPRYPDLARRAADFIKLVEADPKAVPVLQQDRVASLLKKLSRLEREAEKDAARQLDILNLLDTIVEKYPACEAGRTAAARLLEMRKDEKLMARLNVEADLRKLRSQLNMAEQFEKNGKPEEAQKIYTSLGQRYPGKSIAQLRESAAKRDP